MIKNTMLYKFSFCFQQFVFFIEVIQTITQHNCHHKQRNRQHLQLFKHSLMSLQFHRFCLVDLHHCSRWLGADPITERSLSGTGGPKRASQHCVGWVAHHTALSEFCLEFTLPKQNKACINDCRHFCCACLYYQSWRMQPQARFEYSTNSAHFNNW